MSDILNIEQLREMAVKTIDIPDFDNKGTIKIKVQKPRLLTMAAQGKIPNHLLNIASTMVMGKRTNSNNKESQEALLTKTAKMIELYCMACMVNPTYNEFKDIMTDAQMNAVFNWAIGMVGQLDSFRTDKGDGTSDNNGQEVQQKAE